MAEPSSHKKSIPSQAYQAKYYQTARDGYIEFSQSHGGSLPLRFQVPLALADITQRLRIVNFDFSEDEGLCYKIVFR